MEEFEFSFMRHCSDNELIIQPYLDSFTTQTLQPVRPQIMEWAGGRSDLIKVALYHHGPDASEVGSTWVSDLVAMNALRPFSNSDLKQIGSADSFLPSAWKTTHISKDSTVWSIPWLAESFILHYRKDILAANGIAESSAFSTPEALYETVLRLKKAGYKLPIALPSGSTGAMILHLVATWVWQAGGDLVSPDGHQVVFTSPQAIAGLQSFARLLQAIGPEGLKILNSSSIQECFTSGQAPLAIAGPWLSPDLYPNCPFSEKDWDVVRLPGPPFVGGTDLVIWKHSRHENSALSLIRLLTSIDESSRYGEATGIFSARNHPNFASRYSKNRFLRTMYESIQVGRSYPTLPLWGLVEDRLVSSLTMIWDTLASNPQANVDETVTQILGRVARSLNLTLSQR
jgi:multiple sugar transport system substrate-binding protein